MTEPTFTPHPVAWDEGRVARFWDFMSTRVAPDLYFSARMAPEVARIVERQVPRPGTIVDVGCGSGDLLVELQRRGHPVRGVDTSPESVEIARRRLGDADGLRVQVATTGTLPIDDSSVDTVLLVEVVEHLPDDPLRQVLAEVRRVLRAGGHLVVTTPNNEDLGRDLVQCPDCGAEFHRMQHVRSWTAGSLAAAFDAAGFEPVRLLAMRLPERSGPVQRLARRVWYRLRGDRRNLIGVARRP